MRRLILLSLSIWLTAFSVSADAATGRVIKVLPHFLDAKGRHSLSPSLYERDAYQAHLRTHPELRSGLQFDVQWKAKATNSADLKLRVEVRGSARGDLPKPQVLERAVKPSGWLGRWASVRLTDAEYKELGEMTAWRVTLWDGKQLLSEQKSFLW